MRREFDCACNIFLNRRAFEITGNAAVTSTCQWTASTTANQTARYWMSLPDWMNKLKATVLPKPSGSGFRLKGLGIVSIAIAAAAIFALTYTDGAGRNPRAVERHRSHRQRQRPRDLSCRRCGISAGGRRARIVAADLASRRGTKCGRLRTGPIRNLRRLPLQWTALIGTAKSATAISARPLRAMPRSAPALRRSSRSHCPVASRSTKPRYVRSSGRCDGWNRIGRAGCLLVR